MSDGLSYDERAAEITARIMVSLVTAGGASNFSWPTSEDNGKRYGASVRAAYKEIFDGVLASLKDPE